jgi:hypothetical protein
LALAPLAPVTSLRSVAGLRLGDASVAVHLDHGGGERLVGCPPELRLVG